MIRDALRLSAHVLTRDPKQLASQLWGRLQTFKGEGIHSLLADAKTKLWLRPRKGSLVSPGGPLLRTLEGHTGRITSVAVVDGRRAVSGSRDGTLRAWDLETGKTLAVVTLEGVPLAVAVTPDGRIVMTGDDSGRVHFLDLVLPQ